MNWNNAYRNVLLLLAGLCVGVILHQQQVVREMGERISALESTPVVSQDSSGGFSASEALFVRASRKVKQSVVGVVASRVVVDGSLYSRFMGRFYQIPELHTRQMRNMGSGVVVDKRGYLITNYHVVEGAKEVHVSFSSGKTVLATVVGVDPLTDLAVLSVKPQKDLQLVPVKIAPDKDLRVGQWVLAVGNPFLNFIRNADPSVTAGVVSALHRNFALRNERHYQDMIQTDAAINPGNSGGALINLSGDVVGINTFVYNDDEHTSVGIGFSIPMERAMKVAQELIAHGTRRLVWAGVRVKEVVDAKNQNSLLIINSLEKDGPGAKAGLHQLDTVIAVGHRIIQSEKDLSGLFLTYFPGDTLPVIVKRGDEEIEITLKLEEYVRQSRR